MAGPRADGVPLRAYLERLLAEVVVQFTARVDGLNTRVDGLDRLTDSKFITHRTLLDSQAEKVALALASADKAVTKAELANEKRFESVNEFRAQQRDLIAEFVRQDFLLQALEARDAANAALAARVRELELARSTSSGHESGGEDRTRGQRAALASYVGIATFVLAVIIFAANFLTKT